MPPPPPRSEIDHTKRPLLTHMPPPKDGTEQNTELQGGGEGVITLPLPHGKPEKVAVKEPLLFGHRKMYHSAKKRNKQL